MSEALERKLEVVESKLSGMCDCDILPIWNDYCADIFSDNYVYDNDEEFFRENFSNPYEAIRAVCYGDYRFTDSYVKFDAYGNLKSFEYRCDVIYYDELAEWYLEHHEGDCEEWFDDLYAKLEEEALDIALDEIEDREDGKFAMNLQMIMIVMWTNFIIKLWSDWTK